MIILEVAHSNPPEIFIRRHIDALQGTGVEVKLLVRQHLAKNNAASLGESINGQACITIPNFDHLSLPGKLLALRHLANGGLAVKTGLAVRDRVLLGFLKGLKPDLIHFHNAQLAVMMAWAAREMGIPYTVSLRGTDVQVFPLRSEKDQGELRQALEGASGIHTVCDQLGALILPWGLKSTTIYTTIPIPPDLPRYCPTEDGCLHLLSTGRLHWRKNFPGLLRAVRDLLDRGVPARLKIIGSGEDEDSLRYWIRQLGLEASVDLAGKGSEETIRAELGRAHAYVQSSIAEGLSNATAEAMAWGCPVFATDAGGTREAVQDGETGFLLDATRPELWAEKLRLAENRELMGLVQEKAYKKARDTFRADKHAEAFIQFFKCCKGPTA